MNYNSFNNYLKKQFGEKVRKIGINANFSCPKRDSVGCIFCNELAFSEFAETKLSLKEQIEHGKRDGCDKYIAYFQNATGTNASLEELKKSYDFIKECPEIVGLSISTRPDCVDEEKLDLIAEYTDSFDVWVEYGMQTVHDKTLEFLKRGHTNQDTVKAIKMTAKRGIKVGVHVMLGIPGETRQEMLETANEISRMPVSGVKLHVFHVLKNTELEQMYKDGKVAILGQDEYVSLACDFIEHLDKRQIVLRAVSDARKEYLVAPEWLEDKLGTLIRINDEFKKRGTHQGSLFGCLSA
jgi:radical SAM protein (TIGR01212 family)